MTRNEFIVTMKTQVEAMRTEYSEIKKSSKIDDNAYHKLRKLGHEISAIENAIREMERA